MRTNQLNLRKMILAALLSAIGIAIPLVSPLKIIIEPASFTLASHVPLFIGMFISPAIAAVISLGTTVGFFLAGFSPVVVFRAATHLIFVLVGAIWLKKKPNTVNTFLGNFSFVFIISVLHAVFETLVSSYFYFGGTLTSANYESGFFVAVFLLVGVGTIAHSIVDYFIAVAIFIPISKIRGVDKITCVGTPQFKIKKEKAEK